MAIRTLDLFCGGGGTSWGAKLAGAEIVCGVDSWDLAVQTFQASFPEAKAIRRRLTSRSGHRTVGDIGEINLILASPECTNHTCARGSHERNEDSRLTAMHALKFVRAFRPRWVVMENVIQMRSWSRYGELISALRDELGYHVSEQVLDAAHFGVPQRRRRLFVICDRSTAPPEIKPHEGTRARRVIEILDPKGTWECRPLYSKGRAKPTLERAERAMAELGRGEPFLIVYYSSDGCGGWQRLDRPLRTITTLDRFGLVDWEDDTAMLRMLQVPELMRAMGFEDGYTLPHGSRRDRIKLLGNGVCPPVMEVIVRTITRQELTELPPKNLPTAAE